jgi:UDP-GlcNAc:undecaprenyl-phosphate GlcNAc-1-phosphate transferase
MDFRNIIINPSLQIFVCVLFSLLFAYLLSPFAVFLAKKLGAIDVPGSAAHKRHRVPTPLAGGLVLALVMPLLVFASGLWSEKLLRSVFLGGTIIFLFGLTDDIYGLSAPQKFFGQFIAAAVLISAGVTIRFLETVNISLKMSLFKAFSWGLTLFWVVGITNAFNLIDSMDGLLAGLTVIMASFFAFFAFFAGQFLLACFSAMLVCVSIALYFYNKTPARFFLGDSGSQLFGFFLAAIAILYRPPDLYPESTWFLPILLLGVPIFDTTLVVFSRWRRHQPIFVADRSHTYHRLVRLGLSAKQAVFAIHALAFLLSLLALLAMFLPPNSAMFLFFAALCAGGLLIIFFETAAPSNK